MSLLHAAVAVPRPVRRLFTYSIPASLQPACRRGVRVVVPFGARRITGYVLDVFTPAPSAPATDDLRAGVVPGPGRGGAPPPMIKPIEQVIDADPVLDDALLDLTRFAADYYVVSWGAMIRAALPGPGASAERVVRLTDAGRAVAGGGAGAAALPPGARDEAARALLGALGATRSGSVRPATLRARLGARFDKRALSRLERAGLVESGERATAARARAGREIPAGAGVVVGTDPGTVAAPRLTSAQRSAVGAVGEAIAGRRYGAFLLFGVTGSGKTEVYIRAIEQALAAGRDALYLVPEIGLTPLLARRLRARFGDALELLHSRLGAAERREAWRRVRAGTARVVLGPRSALFAPLRDPGVIVVDEEQDLSYKQEEYPRYNGRDLAIVRARRAGAAVILGSATPSMESYAQAKRGRYRLIELPERIGSAGLPPVRIVDMRREFQETGRETILSRRLAAALRETLGRREQCLILLNRRGFSTFALCRACGATLECRRCSIALTLHLRERRLRCHYCDAARAVPEACPQCGATPLHFGGTGTERLEQALRAELPQARIARLDRDTARGRGAVERVLTRFEAGEIDLLLGTQMIAKGHDFPNVTLVGVIAADALLGLPDFRAGERTFQLLAQVAGRSGRGEHAGEVIVQAYDADHHAVRAAAAHDFTGFARRELAYRKAMAYPPYTALAMLVVRDRAFDRARDAAQEIAGTLRAAERAGVEVLGPAPAPLLRLRGLYRVQVIVKAATRAARQAALEHLMSSLEKRRERMPDLTIDVDPVATL